ncbi:hypothetical protein TPAR_00535 [Tolypocladium paradoxum]|uniref:Uncharacterized protein n=1 Tax=Tolypocladium paradoxum TaxID=94208 RepID=A0A2S4L9Z2_9HYPO|nr:hypothetical protein TPAR_00535 [Tolypocladium paradoxum]
MDILFMPGLIMVLLAIVVLGLRLATLFRHGLCFLFPPKARQKVIGASLVNVLIISLLQKPREPQAQSSLVAYEANSGSVSRAQRNVRKRHLPDFLRLKPHVGARPRIFNKAGLLRPSILGLATLSTIIVKLLFRCVESVGEAGNALADGF